MTTTTARRLAPGDRVAPRELTTILGAAAPLPAADGLTHLQFRRFAGCPVCNLHLHALAQRHDEISAAGIHEIVVFHSTVEEMLPHQGSLPFAAVADPEKKLYAAFGVEASPRAVLHPKVWLGGVLATRSVLRGLRAGRRPGPAKGETILGLPADFLIAPDGGVRAAHYGRHANDQWGVEELLSLAAAHR
ncbi:alkyl hydroperoxide reductase [Streptomyces sp. AcH 505]|uniref:peroxiredoxin-like family protein n=1 Tax=Streptomyces sp. AcH 505 TaxID=352211 RepID=UPI000591F501|nr:alkyl hydroperoxide reductase [Streptomyces sp. AcH 505]